MQTTISRLFEMVWYDIIFMEFHTCLEMVDKLYYIAQNRLR